MRVDTDEENSWAIRNLIPNHASKDSKALA